MTPTERAYKHGILKAQIWTANALRNATPPYAEPELQQAFKRGVERAKAPVYYTMPPRPEPTR